ncbi:hypothetical protein MBLNU13_g02942t1 [Cladosporium sp. NU13]
MDAITSRVQQLTTRATPLQDIKDWSDDSTFSIDALGLVTLLGAEEVNQSVGHLQRRRYTEYLPLLAAFVLAGNRFTAEQPGFVIYNLTDGITSTELKGWFTRWIMSQNVNNATTVLTWKKRERHTRATSLIAPALAFVLVAPLLILTILIGDWYGVGNAGAIIISIFVRIFLLWQLRHARDKTANKLEDQEEVKDLCIIRSDGKMVTCKAPAPVLMTFTMDCEVMHKRFYKMARRLGWLALGVHMCILGMCTLFTQIYTVILLVLSTWALCSDFDFDIGRKLHSPKKTDEFSEKKTVIPFNEIWEVEKVDHPKKKPSPESKDHEGIKWDRRQVAWARIGPTETQETMMKRWNLLPYEENRKWWEDYNKLKNELHRTESNNEKAPSTPTAPTRPPLAQTTSTRPLLETPSTTGTYTPSVGGTPTPSGSRCPSPAFPGTAPKDPAP